MLQYCERLIDSHTRYFRSYWSGRLTNNSKRILQNHISLLIRRNFFSTCQAVVGISDVQCPCESVSCYFYTLWSYFIKRLFSYLCFTPSFLPFNVLIDEFVCMYNSRKSSKTRMSNKRNRPIWTTTKAKNQRQENKAIYQSYVNFYFNWF